MSKSFWFTTVCAGVFALLCFNIVDDRIVSIVLTGYVCLGVFVVGLIDIWGRKGW